ncbi:hypothetical protein KW794_03695 [Candidatus Saccharibacteria bacterium]|nr:hypothetical protein [Candidatus Saccharibacteria bacterium]
MKTVVVIEGFSGGPMHTRQFRKALTEAGFKVIKDRKNADVIIAHSAGIYAVPTDAKAKLLMLIGPTYWPGQLLIKRTLRHARSSGSYHIKNFGWLSFLWKKLLEFYYIFRRHLYLWLGILNNNKLAHLNKLMNRSDQKTIIIRNSDDPYCSPSIKDKVRGPQTMFVELPGVHDDFVTNPGPYIDLLLKEI